MPNPFLDIVQAVNAYRPGQGQTYSASGRDMNTQDDSSQTADLNSDDLSMIAPGKDGNVPKIGFGLTVPPIDKKLKRRPDLTKSEIVQWRDNILKNVPTTPFQNNAQTNQDGTIKVAPPNQNFFPDIISFGNHYGFIAPKDPLSDQIMSPKFKHTSWGDPHHYGLAVDFSLTGKDGKKHSDDEINYFIQQALANGYSVEDARDQAGNGHIHISGTAMGGGARYVYTPVANKPRQKPTRPGLAVPSETTPKSMKALPVPRAYQGLDPQRISSQSELGPFHLDGLG